MKLDAKLNQAVIIIDEAHNISQVTEDNQTISLSEKDFCIAIDSIDKMIKWVRNKSIPQIKSFDEKSTFTQEDILK